MLRYSTLNHSNNHLNHHSHLTANGNQSNCLCGNTNNCTNCDQIPSHSFLDSTSGEITLESFDGNTTTLNRKIPVSILLPHSSSNQMNAQTPNLMSSMNHSPLTCGHLSTFVNQASSTICNSIDQYQSSNTSVDQTTTTNSLEQQNTSTNRVFFIHTSNADNQPDAFVQQTSTLRPNQFNSLRTKVQITDSGYDKNEPEANQMLYLTSQSNADQYDYYKLLNRTPLFDAYVPESNYGLNYNGLELLTSPYLHNQVNLNDCNENGKLQLESFEKELTIGSNVELLDSKIEPNQSVSLNSNKTVSFMDFVVGDLIKQIRN